MEIIPTYWCPFCKQVSVAERDDDGNIECPKCGDGKNDDSIATENERIAIAYKAIESIWGDTMGWEQIETLARSVVRALDAA